MRLSSLVFISSLTLIVANAVAREADGRAGLAEVAGAELRALADEGPLDFRLRALIALGRSADPGAIARLASADWSGAPPARRMAALARTRDPSRYRSIYAALARADRPDLELLGSAGLLRLGVAATEPFALAIRSRDRDGPLACELAADVGVVSMIPFLRERFEDEDEGGVAALGALARLTDEPRERARCVRALRREVLAARTPRRAGGPLAIEALAAIDAPAAAEALWAAAESAPTVERRDLAVQALGRRGIAAVAEKLTRQVEAGSLTAATSLAALGDVGHLPRLRGLLEHPTARIRDAAAVATARVGRLREGATELAACLADARGEGRQEARLEIAASIWDSTIGRDETRFGPQLEVEVPCGLTADERSLLQRTIAAAVAAAGESCRIEMPAPGVALVILRFGLSRERIAVAALAVEEAGYSVVTSEDTSEPEPTGLSP